MKSNKILKLFISGNLILLTPIKKSPEQAMNKENLLSFSKYESRLTLFF